MAPTKSVYHKYISSTDVDAVSGIIDFDQLRKNDEDIYALDREVEDEALLEEVVLSKENLLESEDPTRKFQYPLINTTKPPSGIPYQCRKDLWSQSNWYIKLRSLFLVSESPLMQCGSLRGFLGLHHERFRHLITQPYMIHPYSDFCAYWNFFIGLFVGASIIYAPLMIAFRPVLFFHGEFRIVSLFACTVLLLDVALNFNTGVRDKYSNKVILERTEVRKRYFRGWFFYDLMTRLPWDPLIIYGMMSEEESMDVRNLGWLRIIAFFIRVLRYQKIFQVLCRVSDTLAFKSLVTPWMLKLVLLIVHTLHWLACFHWLLPDVANVGLEEYKEKSWVTSMDLWDKSFEIQYLNCFLRSLANLFTLDGGDFIPREPEEILCTGIGIVLSVSMFGYFISSFSTIVSEINASTEKYDQMLDLVENYLTFQKIPDPLQQKVLQFFETKFRGHMFPDLAIMATLSPTLRTEIACHNCRQLVEKVPLFKTLPPSVIVSIVEKLNYEIYVPGDIIIQPNTTGDCMYFVQDGELDVLSLFGKKIDTLRDGDFFGEISLITNERRMKTVLVKIPCEIYSLNRDDFRQCVQAFPEIYEEILAVARVRIDAEKRAMEEAAQSAEKIRMWKKKKEVMARIVKEENETKVNEFGIDLVGEEESEGSSLVTGVTGLTQEELRSLKTRKSLKTLGGRQEGGEGGQEGGGKKKEGKIVAGVKDFFKHLKKK